MGRRARRNSDSNSEHLPAKVPQANGRGALYAGGVPGNKGGGRIPDQVRRDLLEAYHTHGLGGIRKLLQLQALTIGKGKKRRVLEPELDHFLKAAEHAAKHGLKPEILTLVSPDVQNRLQRQIILLTSKPTWDTQELLAALEPIWTDERPK